MTAQKPTLVSVDVPPDGHALTMAVASAAYSNTMNARSKPVDVDDGLREGLRGLLRQVVADAALDQPVFIAPGELLRVGTGVRVRRTVGIAFHGDGRHTDGRGQGPATDSGPFASARTSGPPGAPTSR
jgi:hypothetical protein